MAPEVRISLHLPSGEVFPVRDSIVIGRGSNADLVINDPEVSRRHATIKQEGNITLLLDLQSRNGTFVNGQRIRGACTLRDGDEIRVGQTRLLVRTGGTAPPTERRPVIATNPLHVLARMSRQISGVLDANQLADAVTRTLQEEYGVEGASLILLDPQRQRLYFASASGVKGAALHAVELRRGEGIAGWVIEHKEPVLAPAARADPRHAGWVDAALGFETRSLVCAPILTASGEVLGALEVVNPISKPAFDEEDLEFLSLVAQQVAVSLSNAESWEVLARVAGVRRRFIALAPVMVRLVADAAALYSKGIPLYLAGEPGTGKRSLAQWTHEAVAADAPFTEINCAGRSAMDLQRALFGAGDPGVLRTPQPAAVYLSNLAAAPLPVQAHLARYLTETPAESRPRIIAAGPVTLLAGLSQGHLAPELYAVLEPGQLVLPPLRARLDDLEALLDHFVALYSERFERERFLFSADALAALRAYTWPGNVREMEAVVKRLALLSEARVIDRAELERLAPEVVAIALTTGTARPLNAVERRRAALQAHALSDLKSDDPARRHEAVTVLERYAGRGSLELLCTLLNDPVPWVRVRAAEAVASLGDAAISALSDRLEREDDPAVATRLLELLAEHGDASVLPAVERHLHSPGPGVRRAAIRVLRRLGGPTQTSLVAQAISDEAAEVRAEALATLLSWGQHEAGEQLLSMVTQGSAEERYAACPVIGEVGIGTTELIAALGSADPALRVAAVRALGRSGQAAALQPLLAALADQQVRAEAVQALGELGASVALPALLEIVATAESTFLRRAAIAAIGSLGDRSALPHLTSYLAQEGLASAALAAIVRFADPSAEEAIAPLLTAMDTALVEQAVGALGKLGTERSVRPLLDLVKRASHRGEAVLDAIIAIYRRSSRREAVLQTLREALDDEEQRLWVLQLLGELADPVAVPWLLAYHDWSEEAGIALLKLGRAAVPGLIEAARKQPALRDYIGRLLSELGLTVLADLLPLLLDRELAGLAEGVVRGLGEKAVPNILSALERSTNPILIARLVQVLGRTGTPQLVPYVAGFLEHPDTAVRYAAIIALGDLDDPRSEAYLLEGLDGEDETAIALAILSLGRLRSEAALERFPLLLQTRPVWRLRYAVAAALSNYTARDPVVGTQLRQLVQEGLPYTASFVTANGTGHAELLALLHEPSTPLSRKLRALSLLTTLPDEEAVPLLGDLLRRPLEPALRSAVVTAAAHRGAAIVGVIVGLLADPVQRQTGLAVLQELRPPAAVVSVLRRMANTIQIDDQLRSALREMGELLIGPLFDRIYQDWDLDTLTLLWSVAQVIHGESLDLPPTVRDFTMLQQRFQG